MPPPCLTAARGWSNPPLSTLVLAPLCTAAYFGSLLATLYVSLVMHSYLFSLLFCGAQVGLCWAPQANNLYS